MESFPFLFAPMGGKTLVPPDKNQSLMFMNILKGKCLKRARTLIVTLNAF